MNESGHLMWRIDCYQQKLKDAIENGSILLSPIFLSSQYGYTLQVKISNYFLKYSIPCLSLYIYVILQAELNLNGIGKWKGRHLTAAVFIVPGEYDPILSWPANLQADIIFKDQKPQGKEVKIQINIYIIGIKIITFIFPVNGPYQDTTSEKKG